jgi:hypothetical protein
LKAGSAQHDSSIVPILEALLANLGKAVTTHSLDQHAIDQSCEAIVETLGATIWLGAA